MKLASHRPARLLAAYAVAAACAAGAAQAQQQRCMTDSKFGPNDEVGNLNHVTPAKTLAATKLVTKGKAYRLGIETNKDTPAFPPRTPQHASTERSAMDMNRASMSILMCLS